MLCCHIIVPLRMPSLCMYISLILIYIHLGCAKSVIYQYNNCPISYLLYIQTNDCTCDTEYVVERCKCDLACSDNGRCVKILDGAEDDYEMCDCDIGYTGEQCTERMCTLDCGDNGRCIIGKNITADICDCFNGYTGDLCDKIISDSGE